MFLKILWLFKIVFAIHFKKVLVLQSIADLFKSILLSIQNSYLLSSNFGFSITIN